MLGGGSFIVDIYPEAFGVDWASGRCVRRVDGVKGRSLLCCVA
jgi:hypothetical protein